MPENNTAPAPTETKSVADKMYPQSTPAEAPAPAADPAKPVDAAKPGEAPAVADGTKPVEGSTTGEKPAVPAKYELKLPEGSPLDPAQLEAVSAYAKEKGLTNEQAQEVVNRDSSVISNVLKEQQTQFDAEVKGWQDAIAADKEIGGTNLTETVLLTKATLERFATKEFIAELDRTKMGNHPELMRFLVRVGKASAPAKLVQPNAPQVPTEVSRAEKFYGPSAKN